VPASTEILGFESASKWVNGEVARLVAVPAPEGFEGEAVVAAIWDGDWRVMPEDTVSVFSVMDAGLASDEELESVGLPFPEEPYVETALDGLDEEEHGELETGSRRGEASPLFAKRADKERNVKLGARERALKGFRIAAALGSISGALGYFSWIYPESGNRGLGVVLLIAASCLLPMSIFHGATLLCLSFSGTARTAAQVSIAVIVYAALLTLFAIRSPVPVSVLLGEAVPEFADGDFETSLLAVLVAGSVAYDSVRQNVFGPLPIRAFLGVMLPLAWICAPLGYTGSAVELNDLDYASFNDGGFLNFLRASVVVVAVQSLAIIRSPSTHPVVKP